MLGPELGRLDVIAWLLVRGMSCHREQAHGWRRYCHFRRTKSPASRAV
jgi:hypothetical protein